MKRFYLFIIFVISNPSLPSQLTYTSKNSIFKKDCYAIQRKKKGTVNKSTVKIEENMQGLSVACKPQLSLKLVWLCRNFFVIKIALFGLGLDFKQFFKVVTFTYRQTYSLVAELQ